MVNLNFQEIRNRACIVIEALPWVQEIIKDIYAGVEKGCLETTIYPKDCPAIKESENIQKLCFLLRQRGFFVRVSYDEDSKGQIIKISWDWSEGKQQAIDLSEAIGDQLMSVFNGIDDKIEVINETLGAYAIAKLKGDNKTHRTAISIIENLISNDITEE